MTEIGSSGKKKKVKRNVYFFNCFNLSHQVGHVGTVETEKMIYIPIITTAVRIVLIFVNKIYHKIKQGIHKNN